MRGGGIGRHSQNLVAVHREIVEESCSRLSEGSHVRCKSSPTPSQKEMIIMSEADKMIFDLGYSLYVDDDYSLEFQRMNEGVDEYICFGKRDHEVWKQWCMESGDISMPELKAIVKKCEEMNWL